MEFDLEGKKAWKHGDPERRSARRMAADIMKAKEDHEKILEEIEGKFIPNAVNVFLCMLLAFVMICCFAKGCHAYDIENPRPMFRANCLPLSGYTCSEIAGAIYKAENSKNHPYGIMTKYKHTTPREACLNTIKHRAMEYVRVGEPLEGFIVFLGRTYSPPSINPNWVKLVKWFLKHSEKG